MQASGTVRSAPSLRVFLSGLIVLPLDSDTAVDGGLLRRTYAKSHGVGLDDALIAATASSETGPRSSRSMSSTSRCLRT